MPELFTCALCGKQEEKGSDQQALEEYAQVFKGHALADALIVCDGCYEPVLNEAAEGA